MSIESMYKQRFVNLEKDTSDEIREKMDRFIDMIYWACHDNIYCSILDDLIKDFTYCQISDAERNGEKARIFVEKMFSYISSKVEEYNNDIAKTKETIKMIENDKIHFNIVNDENDKMLCELLHGKIKENEILLFIIYQLKIHVGIRAGVL